MAAYNEAIVSSTRVDRPERKTPEPGTVAALAQRYFTSVRFVSKAQNTKRNYRRAIESFVEKYGDKRVSSLGLQHIEAILSRMADRPGSALELLRGLRVMFGYGVKIGMIKSNPVAGAEAYKTKPFHTWTDAEVVQFEARWPVGTRQRLAFALLLYTAQRSIDVFRLRWPNDTAGFRLTQRKTGTELIIPVHPELEPILLATPRQSDFVITTDTGEPYSLRGFSRVMLDAIRKAGLPVRCKAHGLRKAAARRLAEHDATAHQIAAVTGHRTLAEVEKYTRAVDQPRLAGQAFAKHTSDKPSKPK